MSCLYLQSSLCRVYFTFCQRHQSVKHIRLPLWKDKRRFNNSFSPVSIHSPDLHPTMESPREGYVSHGPQDDNSGHFKDGTPVHTPRPLYAPSFQDAHGRASHVQQQHHQPPAGWKPTPLPSVSEGDQDRGCVSGFLHWINFPRKIDRWLDQLENPTHPKLTNVIYISKRRRWSDWKHFPWLTIIFIILTIACKCSHEVFFCHTVLFHDVQALILTTGTVFAVIIAQGPMAMTLRTGPFPG